MYQISSGNHQRYAPSIPNWTGTYCIIGLKDFRYVVESSDGDNDECAICDRDGDSIDPYLRLRKDIAD